MCKRCGRPKRSTCYSQRRAVREAIKVALYFNHPNSIYYCKKLNYSSTEFHTQGLELDIAIVHWDDDLFLQNGTWKAQHFQREVKDPFQIKLNSYRVILTRGRDGTIIYIPPKPILDETWKC